MKCRHCGLELEDVQLGCVGDDWMRDRQAAKILVPTTLDLLLDVTVGRLHEVQFWAERVADRWRARLELPDDSFVTVKLQSGHIWTFLGDGCGLVPEHLVDRLANVGPRCDEFRLLK